MELCDLAINFLLEKTCDNCIACKKEIDGKIVECEPLDKSKNNYIKQIPKINTCEHWSDKMSVKEILDREG